MALRIVCLLIAILFALLALLALAQAIVIGLVHLVPPGLAWLLAALCYLAIAAVAVLLVRSQRPVRRPLGLASLSPVLGEQIRRKPGRTLLMALIAGALFEQFDRRQR